ncbi:MAG: MASE1 domain-containing protein [Acidobacteriales bacterium]|nr:MASE1 domain-containing protein [Terriglobales bacterium]
MPDKRFLQDLAANLVFAVVYFFAGKLGLSLAFENPSATPVWPPTGIALAALLIFGYRLWPAILVSAFLVNLTTAGTVATSIGIAAGNTLEALLGAYLANRYANGRRFFERAPDVFRFIFLAALVSTMASATCGVTTLALAHFVHWRDYGVVWLTWWLGNAVGDLIVGIFLILWAMDAHFDWSPRRSVEAALLLFALALVGEAVFGRTFDSGIRNYPLEFLCIPVLIWAAFRFGQREAVTAVLILCSLAIIGTLQGLGPFVRRSPNESLLLLQSFMGVTLMMTMVLATINMERNRAELRLHQMAISDPATGLGNYRHLMNVLDEEIHRSRRTKRPFSILMLDMDKLKQINDKHGHLIGTRALVRLAEVLRQCCRASDSAYRYGGDEFLVVLYDTGELAAHQAARRIAEQLSKDDEFPPLSASTGVAVYPEGGETIEKLLQTADRSLYASKGRREAAMQPAADRAPGTIAAQRIPGGEG